MVKVLPFFRFLAAGLLALLLAAGLLRDLGHEVAHLLDLLLGFFLVHGLDGVLDLAAAGVHRFVFEGRHRYLLTDIMEH